MLRPGHELEDLLAPVGLAAFLERTWERAPLFIPGTADKLAGLFDRQRLRRAIALGSDEGSQVYLKAGHQNARGEHREFVIRPEQVTALLEAGLTVQIERLETADTSLQTLLGALRSRLQLAAPLDVAAFLSPPGHGYGLHYDATAMWVLQLEGRKRWWYSPAPAEPFPLQNRVPSAAERAQGLPGYDESTLQESLLGPGDVLYLPAGTWHRVRAAEDSLHLCLTIRPTSPYVLIDDLLQAALLADPTWRHLPAARAEAQPATARREEMERYFGERLAELRRTVERLQPADLYRTWVERVHTASAQAAPVAPLEPGQVLAPLPGRPLTWRSESLADGKEKIILEGGTVRVALPGHARAFVAALVGQTRFPAGTALTWDGAYSWENVEEVLRGLVEVGLLARVSR